MSKLLVLYVLLAVAFATPITVSECGRLSKSFSTYKLTGDIAVGDDATLCFDITGKGITLDGNGFEIRSASGAASSATGVQYSGEGVTVTNLHITNMRTGINAKGKFGTVYNNVITRATNGIDVSATNNLISNNKISNFQTTDESASGIYVYFPALVPVDSYVNITNNVISDIQGDSFAQGISVYYATSVFIGQNRIYNIQGEIMSQDIAVIEGHVDTFENVFTALPADGLLPTWASVLLTAVTLVLSYYLFSTSNVSSGPAPIVQQLEEKRKQIEMEMQKEKERREHEGIQDDDEDEFAADDGDFRVKRIQRFSLSSSVSLLSSPIM